MWFPTMDKKKLITAVALRGPIWDKTNKNHHNSVVLTKLWKEVARECNQQSMALVKGQWKRLRESFMKKLKEATEDGEEPTWPYYNCLMFLKDQRLPKQMPASSTDWEAFELGDSSHRMDDNECKSEYLEDDIIEPDSMSPMLSPLNPSSSITLSSGMCPSISKANLSRVTDTPDRAVDLFGEEQDKIEFSKRKDDRKQGEELEIDEDASFFNSILPHVRALNARKKIKFRLQVLQFLDYELSSVHNPDEFLNN